MSQTIPASHAEASTPVLGRPAAPAPVGQQRSRIPEIDGLRGVAIALIVVYHVWLNRVSGGVDTFFLLSGFLVTMSVLRAAERQGRVRVGAFYARIARRIFPPAVLVLIGIVIATVVSLPQSRWREYLGDVLSAATYVVNWRLAEQAVDYLAPQSVASPVQHYWSLAVQAQFYLLWPLLIAAAGLLAVRLMVHHRRMLAVILGGVFAVSLTYSVYRTSTDQTYAYFETFTRLWEFALGGLLFLALPHLRLPRGAVALAVGWLGLAGLLVCGLVFQAGDQFPGWAALWPTTAGAMLIVTAGAGGRFGADRLLRSTSLRRLGSYSYALYLCHWPVLVCYLTVSGRTTASLRGGVLVILASVLLAMVIKWLAEDRLRHSGIGQRTTRGAFVLAASLVLTVLVASAGWAGLISYLQRPADTTNEADWTAGEAGERQGGAVLGPYPGAAHVAYGGELPELPYVPGPLQVRDDHANELHPGCHQDQDHSEPILCRIGSDSPSRTIAVVGGSRAQHWLPALERVASAHGWQIVAITKSACLFTTSPQYDSCDEWNRRVVDELARMRPDAVFTTSTRVPRGPEELWEGYLDHWRQLERVGVPVLAMRDVPRPVVDVPDCVEIHGRSSDRCGRPAAFYNLDQPARVAGREDIPGNVTLLDFTEYFCPDEYCAPVIGNVIVYHDNSHLTATYARTLAPFLAEALKESTGW